jgi:ribosomal-protein-alanine N-acetyltransferase
VNALLSPALQLRAMSTRDIDAVIAIEALAYSFPWSRGNFIDSLAAGYLAEVLVAPEAGIVGYFVAMTGVDEMHLLNLTVAPERQGRGLARWMLDALDDRCRARALPMLWLEVRASNHRARALYRQRGFAEVGLRRGYYPAARATREDAVVMSMKVPQQRGDDGLG